MSAGREPPSGVVVEVNGTAYPCDVLRDPGLDEAGLTGWAVVPRQELPPVDLDRDTFAVRADVLPAMTMLDVRLTP